MWRGTTQVFWALLSLVAGIALLRRALSAVAQAVAQPPRAVAAPHRTQVRARGPAAARQGEGPAAVFPLVINEIVRRLSCGRRRRSPFRRRRRQWRALHLDGELALGGARVACGDLLPHWTGDRTAPTRAPPAPSAMLRRDERSSRTRRRGLSRRPRRRVRDLPGQARPPRRPVGPVWSRGPARAAHRGARGAGGARGAAGAASGDA